jgi:hypothetical protein
MEPVNEAKRRAEARVGLTLRGKWRLDALIGCGGMAAVYGATHRNGKRVAVKVLHPEWSGVPELRERFLREGYVANKVGHPGSVSVLDDDVAEDGSVFLVMELLEGATLDACAASREGRRLSLEEVVGVGEALLEVLAAAHAQGIVHRDIKPENLFITRDSQLRVLDFGIARLREADSSPSTTAVGSFLGTPAFMAPEQASGRWGDVDARTDLWAVGATLYTLLTGAPVHQAETLPLLIAAAITRPAPSIRIQRADLPPRLADVIDRSLAFDSSQRFADALEMREALRSAFEAVRAPVSGQLLGTLVSARLPEGLPAAPFVVEVSPPSREVATTARAVSSRAVTAAAPRRASTALGLGLAVASVLGALGYYALRETTSEVASAPVVAPTAVLPAPTSAPLVAPAAPAASESAPSSPPVPSALAAPSARNPPTPTGRPTASTPSGPAPKPSVAPSVAPPKPRHDDGF